MQKNKRLAFLNWLDKNLLLALSLLLVIFIPLWPKIPLFQIIPGYIVKIRFEDVLIGITGIVFITQLLRKKVRLHTPLTFAIVIYILVGFVSLLSALFLITTIPLQPTHILKAFLHLFRYMEYFSIFFFVWASISQPKHLKLFVAAFSLVVVATTIYAIGQKYWHWPVYSTMRYEFSSGKPLELVSSAARVPSTFAGHYDYAIYLDLLLPLILGFVYNTKNKHKKLLLIGIFTSGLWGLLMSGLRIACLSYLISIGLLTLLFASRQKTNRKKVKWFLQRITFVGGLTVCMFLLFGQNVYALLNHVVDSSDETIIPQYQLPVPKDELETYKTQTVTIQQEQNLSGCAKEREVSLCIRLESLWPQAITGFKKQPLLGSGYTTLNKRDFNHLAEADGTDNNYLRILGETGLLGFTSFFAIIFLATKQAYQNLQLNNTFLWAAIYLSLLVGLLINALLFDVFAASKVAFGFWAITAICLSAYKFSPQTTSKMLES